MRMNIRGWDESMTFEKLRKDLSRAAFGILYDHLGPARVRGVKDLEMFWITPSAKSAKRGGPPRLMDLRYFPAKRKVTCRVMLAPPVSEDERGWPAYRVAYVREVEQRTMEVLAGIVERLRASGIEVNVAPTEKAMKRKFATLARASAVPAKAPKKTAAAKKVAAK